MSYDILLYPRTPGQSWEEVLAADEEEADDATLADEAALEQGVATFRRIEARLLDLLPGDLETWVAEETGGDVFGELSVPDTGLQVELFAGSAAVSFPYWERPDLDAFHEQVRQAVRVVAEETGYEAFDPQTDATFDGTFDDEAGRAMTRQLGESEVDGTAGAGAPEGTDATGGPAAPGPDPRPDPRQDPAFLRRRGRLYTVIGAVLVLFGLWRLTTEGSGWLTLLVLGIGVLDLLGGLAMLATARRAAESEAAGTGAAPGAGTPDDA